MGIFKKQVKFVSAICPECKGALELDSNLEVAYCKQCGVSCIINGAQKKTKNQNGLESILNFIERQQSIKRQEKNERQKKAEEEENKRKELIKRYWWVYVLVLAGIFAIVITMSILESNGLI